MSGGLRLGLAVPGATAGELLEVARQADRWNLATLWVGDPRAQAANSADSYVTATVGALAAVSEDLRLGMLLALADERQIVRLAEDIAVADQASGGRVELAFGPGAVVPEGWTQRVARLLTAWQAWPLPGRDETVPVIPGPAQPVVPRVVIEDRGAAAALGAGLMVFGDRSDRGSALVPARTILIVEVELGERGVTGWLAEQGAHQRVIELRERAAAAGAQELLLSLRACPPEADIQALGTVLVPALRAADRDVRAIAGDAWTWLTEKADLHAPPPNSGG